jgi:PAS domain S-box-containing protein
LRIRTQFIITILLFGIVLFAIIASVIITNQQVENASRQQEIANNIAQGAGDISYLSIDFLIYRESQQLSRWQSKFVSFSNEVASLHTDKPEQQTLVRNIQANELRLMEVFNDIVSSVTSPSQNRTGALDPTLFQVSWSRMSVQSQVLVSDASRLAELLNTQVDQLQRTNLIFIFAMIGVFAAYFIVSYLIIQQRLLKSIDTLRAGTTVIGSGNLDFKLDETSNDEIGDLSRAFNRMTSNLKAVTASKSDLETEVIERKEAEEELLRVNRELRAITECDKAIVRAADEQMLLNDVCRIMCDVVGYRMAWVGTVEHDKAKTVLPVASAGMEDGYLKNAKITWADTKLGRGPTGTAARTGKTDFCQDFINETKVAPWREAALARGFRSSIAIPLSDNYDNVFGVFTLYAAEPNGFTPAEVKLLEELAGDLAFGINVLRIREERNQAEESLRETRDYLDNLFNYANAPIIVWNPDFEITRFNHAFERLTGRSADEVIGQKLDILFPDDSRDLSLSHIRDAMAGERWDVVEIPIQHVDGSVRIVLWNSATLFDVEGKTPVATIAQGQDITERKKVEEIKDEFIGLVSHELKTPITVVIGSVYTAMSKGISRKDAQLLLQDAASSAESLATIVDNLLELSRAQANRLMIRREKIDIAETIGTIVGKLKGKSDSHKLLVDMLAGLPPVFADKVRMERILNNLVDNAVKYSPNGGDITVFARKEDDCLVVGVKDQGIGISAEGQAKLFQPFERLELLDGVGGVGLGLNVCRRLVEAHGGRIWVESEPDKGATFFFTLPLA